MKFDPVITGHPVDYLYKVIICVFVFFYPEILKNEVLLKCLAGPYQTVGMMKNNVDIDSV